MSRKNRRRPGQATPAMPRPQLGQEFASTGDGRDITRPWVGALALAEDSVLQSRGAPDLKIYREVLSDEEVKSAFTQRQDALISREIKVEAGGERPIDIEAADAMRLQIESLGFDRITRLMHYGVFYGYAVAELIYGVRDNLLWFDEVKVRDRRRFRFSPTGELRLLTPQNMT
ncbi:TPA: portal protein, partial [Serratia marcescens]|nr:portal protein [Serratia marcescens]